MNKFTISTAELLDLTLLHQTESVCLNLKGTSKVNDDKNRYTTS